MYISRSFVLIKKSTLEYDFKLTYVSRIGINQEERVSGQPEKSKKILLKKQCDRMILPRCSTFLQPGRLTSRRRTGYELVVVILPGCSRPVDEVRRLLSTCHLATGTEDSTACVSFSKRSGSAERRYSVPVEGC